MTTSATLSVGLNTEPAKNAATTLKTWLKTELGAVKFGIDASSLKADIAKGIGLTEHRLKLDGKHLTQQVNSAISDAFKTVHEVKIDSVGLTAHIRAAVALGMAGATLGVSPGAHVSSTAPGGMGHTAITEMKVLIEGLLSQPLHELAKAAAALAGNARKMGAGVPSGGNLSATRSISYANPDGTRTRVGEKLEDAAGHLNVGLDTHKVKQAETESATLAKTQMATSQALMNQRLKEIGSGEVAKDKEDMLQAQRRMATSQALMNQRLKEIGSGEVAKDKEDMLQAQRRMATSQALMNQRLKEVGAAETLAQVKTQAAADLAANTVKADARRTARNNYTPLGVDIAGAKGLVAHEGEAAARVRLGPNQGLVDLIHQQEQHRKVAVAGASANKLWANTANDAHAAARGLAGSTGMLWATWGNMAPLVAFAAIGASLRSVFTVGKDVEYQLAFVSALSDGAVVPLNKFADAVRGSMSMPKEAAEGMRALAQNGLSVSASLTALPNILNLATAGEMSLGAAALGATGVMAAFGLQVNDLGRIGDVFTKAAALSNTSVSGMVEAMKQASTVSDQFKVGLEEAAATLATLAQRNIIGTAAGTAMRNMLTELVTPTKKAREALAQLGISAFDGEHQLKSYGDILEQLKAKTTLLNTQGRLTFLNDVFGERGAKAASALLSDYEDYLDILKRIKSESKDFASSITKALQSTSEGKLKGLMSEFQISTHEAFERSKEDINQFIDALRAAAASPEFGKFLDVTGKTVLGLTSFLVENAVVVSASVAGWVVLRSAVGLYVTVATAATVATKAWMAAATGGLSLIALLVVEYFALGKNLSDAEKEQKKFGDGMTVMQETLDREIKSLDAINLRLDRKNSLMMEGQGMRGKEADRVIDSQDRVVEANKFAADTAESKRVVDAAQASIAKFARRPERTQAEFDEKEQAEKLLPMALANLEKNRSLEQSFNRKIRAKETEEIFTELSRRLGKQTEYNKALADFKKYSGGKAKTDGLVIGQLEATGGTPEQFDAMMKKREEQLNSLGGNYTSKHRGDGEHRDALAALNYRKSRYDEEARIEDARYAAAEVILRARESAKFITLEGFAIRQDAEMEKHLDIRKKLAEREEADLSREFGKYLKKGATIDDVRKALDEGADKGRGPQDVAKTFLASDKMNVKDLLDLVEKANRVKAALIELDTKMKGSSEVAGIRVQGEYREIKKGYAEELFKEAEKQVEGLQKLDRRRNELNINSNRESGAGAMQSLYSKEFISSITGKGVNATRALALAKDEEARNRFQDGITRQQLQGAQKLGGHAAQDTVMKDMMAAYDATQPLVRKLAEEEAKLNRELADQVSLVATIRNNPLIFEDPQGNIAAIDREIAGLKYKRELNAGAKGEALAIQSSYVASTGKASTEITDNKRSVGAGWDSFWENYTAAATDNAKLVDNVMSQSFSSMEQGLMKFVTTGKLNFKDFASSLLADAARMMASQALRQLLGMGLNAVMNMFAPTVTGATGDFARMDRLPVVGSANGNVMTDYGALPLKKYAAGGVATSPQLSLFGEGRKPEAYVPLQDGRTIPVTVSGAAGGGGTVVSVQVNIDSNGNSQVESDTSGQKGKQLGDMIQAVVTATIVKEKRQGGLLYA